MNKIKPYEILKWILAFVLVILFAVIGSIYSHSVDFASQ